MELGSPPCSPQMPSFRSGLAFLPFSTAVLTSCPTPPRSITLKGSAGSIFFSTYSGRKVPESSRLNPNVICVRSLVPNEKNCASAAISSAVTAARGTSIMVPIWYSMVTPFSFMTFSAVALMISFCIVSSRT